MATVDIHLPIESTTEWIHALSIPHEDIKRFTHWPLKWLRFATFAVCGAKGHLSTTQGGEVVDYESVSFDNLADRYFYIPDSAYCPVDYKALNDDSECTATAVTRRAARFRRDICARDVECVITLDSVGLDAAHIIPRNKGNKYISYVIRNRSSLYERLPFSGEDDVDIDCIENGMLLRKDLHYKFSKGVVAFLKTPNFAMLPTDVPQYEEGPIPGHRTTLQNLVPTTRLFPVPESDVQADWRDEVHPPPSILLDYMYGAAVVEHWGCVPLLDMLEKQDGFSMLKRSTPKDDEFADEDEPDDLMKDPNRQLGGERNTGETFSSDGSAGLLKAMDHMLLLSILLKGKTPQSITAEWERHRKEEELRSQERSCEKVQQWLNLKTRRREEQGRTNFAYEEIKFCLGTEGNDEHFDGCDDGRKGEYATFNVLFAGPKRVFCKVMTSF